MNASLIFLLFLVKIYFVLGYRPQSQDDEFYVKCVNSIYKECTHQSEFSEQEIENARIYLQNRFNNLPNPAFRPKRPACKKLHVRKDFKCLTHGERLDLIQAIKELYRNGEQTRLALYPHAVLWGPTHKFFDFFCNHRWITNEYEKALKRVNPRVSLPYWSAHEEFDQPELSIIWDYIGRAGNRQSNYCVRDGPFVNVKPCVKRKWINDTHIRWWNPIEHYESALHHMDKLSDLAIWEPNTHFKIHLGVGGSEGQMSVPNAPYDFSFRLYHNWNIEIMFTKWQLQNDQHLVPESYNELLVYDEEIERLRPGNLTHDKMIYFNATNIEAFHLSFGELCYVHDVIVEAINEIISNKRKEMPLKFKKMPKDLLKKYYPKFYSGNYSPLDYLSHPVMDCNRQCKPIRHSLDYKASIEGRSFLERYKYAGLINLQDQFLEYENLNWKLIDDLNRAGYCSPSIIS